MKEYYTVYDLITTFKISKETFYKVKGKNKQLFTENAIKVREEGKSGKPVFKYNQSVFDFLASQYGKGEDEKSAPLSKKILLEVDTTSPEAHAQTQTRPIERPQEAEEGESIDKSAQTKIEALQAEIKALKAQLEKAEKEKAEKENQLGIALLCLQQEKAEKQLLLPAPKKGIGARIKGLFGKKTE